MTKTIYKLKEHVTDEMLIMAGFTRDIPSTRFVRISRIFLDVYADTVTRNITATMFRVVNLESEEVNPKPYIHDLLERGWVEKVVMEDGEK
jgi:hypothetical protein